MIYLTGSKILVYLSILRLCSITYTPMKLSVIRVETNTKLYLSNPASLMIIKGPRSPQVIIVPRYLLLNMNFNEVPLFKLYAATKLLMKFLSACRPCYKMVRKLISCNQGTAMVFGLPYNNNSCNKQL